MVSRTDRIDSLVDQAQEVRLSKRKNRVPSSVGFGAGSSSLISAIRKLRDLQKYADAKTAVIDQVLSKASRAMVSETTALTGIDRRACGWVRKINLRKL
jgi:hypothetical protein